MYGWSFYLQRVNRSRSSSERNESQTLKSVKLPFEWHSELLWSRLFLILLHVFWLGKLYYLEIALLHCQESLSSFWLSFNVGSICHWAEPFTWNIILNLEIKFYCLFCELITFLPSIIPPSPFPVWCDRLPGDHWASSLIFLWRRCKRCRSGSTPMKYLQLLCEYFKAWL